MHSRMLASGLHRRLAALKSAIFFSSFIIFFTVAWHFKLYVTALPFAILLDIKKMTAIRYNIDIISEY